MSPMQYRQRREYELVVKYTEQLHDLMESGKFWKLGFFERRKLVRRVNRLYRRLAGVFSLGPTRTILLAAGVLSLAACSSGGGDGGGDTGDGNVTISIGGTTVTAYVTDAEANVEFTVETVDISGTPTYQWYYDDAPVSGATDTTFTYAIPKTINTDGLEDFYSPRGGAPNLHEVRVEVTDSETTETFSATVDLTVRIEPEFQPTVNSYDWMPMSVGIYGEFLSFDNTVLYGDLDGDGDIDALSSDESYYTGYSFNWFKRDDTEDIAFGYGGEMNLYGYFSSGSNEYTFIRPADLMDLDGDGDADLVAGNYVYYNGPGYTGTLSFGFSVFENDGTPNFDDAETITVPGIDQTLVSFDQNPDSSWPYGVRYSTRMWMPSMKFVDMDGDGDIDLLYSHTEYNGGEERVITMQLNTGSNVAPSFGTPVDLVNGDASLSESDLLDYLLITAADVDRDGDVDIFATEARYTGSTADYSGVLFFKNTGTADNPVFTTSADSTPFDLDFGTIVGDYTPFAPFDTLVVDLDGDGDLDIVAGWYGDSSYSSDKYPIVFFNDSIETDRPDWIYSGGGAIE